MTRLAMWMVAVLAIGCATKPSEEDCRKAIGNMQTLMGTDNLRDSASIEGEVRRCKGGSSKKAVQCAIKAQSLDDLRGCDFYKVPENAKGVGTQPAGSAAPSGSAAPTGSAAPSGSAAPTGSAAGSGDTGSAAAGSAAVEPAGSAGSATGSAAAPAAGKQ